MTFGAHSPFSQALQHSCLVHLRHPARDDGRIYREGPLLQRQVILDDPPGECSLLAPILVHTVPDEDARQADAQGENCNPAYQDSQGSPRGPHHGLDSHHDGQGRGNHQQYSGTAKDAGRSTPEK